MTQDLKPQPLLGRDRELEHLDTGLADACAGHGRLYLITGEPGIGKTRLAEALGARAAAKGMISIWGRCWENPGAPVYWPWAQALRALIDARDPALLQEELGGGGDWIAEIVPELRQRVSGIEPLRPLRSEQARFALFDAVNTFLRCVSQNEPILLVLDDLHAADIESLAMLDFIVRSLGAMHAMIVAAYQDAAVHERPDEVEKLFGALGARSRHLPLGGVEKDDMRMIVEAELGASPPPDLVQSLHTTTEGNPFFACEVTRLLVSEGQLTAGSIGGDGATLPLPETVKETIRRRFDPLQGAGMEMLKSAAVIGRDFRFRTLESVLGCDSETLIGLLDKALAADLIVEVPGAIGRYRFTHGLVQKTLYSELTARERTRLHQRVGNALEEVYGDTTEHLAELAHHFAAAAPTGSAEKALDFATRAGHEAMRVLAYDRAAEHFNLALDLAEQFGLERPVELQLARGLALTRIQDPSARERLLEAAAAARTANRADHLAEAAIGIHVFNLTPGIPDETSVSLLEEALERIGDEDSALRARLLARLATALYYKPGTADRRNSLVTDAVDMARRLDDPAVLAYVLINGQLATWGPDTTERDLEWVDELLVLTADAGNVELALQTRTRQIDYLLELDDLAGADIAIEALERMAANNPDPRALAYAPLQRARRAALEGRFEEAERSNAEAGSVGAEIEDRMVQLLAVAQLAMLRWNQGRIGEVEEVVRRFADSAPGIVGWRAALARIYCDLGREAEARRELDRLDEIGFANLPRYNGWLNMMALLAEVCAHLKDTRRASSLYPLLLPFERRNVVTAQCCFDGPAATYLGIMAATAGDYAAASRHFEAARTVCERLNARPFIALLNISEAQMLSARGEAGDIEQAAELLQRAGEIASELGLDRIVERAERARRELGEVEPAQVAKALATRPLEALSPAQAELCREGDVWAFHFDGRAVRIRDSRGIRSLAELLDNPGVEIHSLELAALGADPETRGRANVPPDGTASGADNAGPVLDSTAKAAYRRRLEELHEEAEQAESFNDPERAAKAKDEIDALTQALASAVGFGGRDRKSASNAERARVAVTKAVRATLKRINELDADLGQELGATIRTGTFCVYEPDRRQPVTWRVEVK